MADRKPVVARGQRVSVPKLVESVDVEAESIPVHKETAPTEAVEAVVSPAEVPFRVHKDQVGDTRTGPVHPPHVAESARVEDRPGVRGSAGHDD